MRYYQREFTKVIAFGLGLLVATIFPPKCVLIIASITIIIIAITICRR